MLVQVSLSLNVFEPFTYEYLGEKNTIRKGMRVVVPVGNRMTTGWVVATSSDFRSKVKPIIGILEDPFLPDKNFLKYAEAISSTYFISVGKVLDMSLSPKRKSIQQIYFRINEKTEKLINYSLNEIQSIGKKKNMAFFYKSKCEPVSFPDRNHFPNEDDPENSYILNYERLETYKKIIHPYLSRGLSILITVPDNSTANYFKQKLENSETYHSKMKINERENLWCDCFTGNIKTLVGGLSAILLPIKNLGCIISERSGSYLYRRTSFSGFNVNHLARLRADQFQLPFYEGYSTYTSESFLRKKQVLVEDIRHKKEVEITVRRLPKKEPGIPPALLEILKEKYKADKKILLVINKKNSSQYLFCQKCLKLQYCRSCSGILNLDESGISCSKCDFAAENINRCGVCNTELVSIRDISISSLKEMIQKQLTETGVFTLSAGDLSDIHSIINQLKEYPITIATPVVLNPFFKNIFNSIIYYRPESIFEMNEFSTGEMIFSMVSELKELIKDQGSIDIFSVFHFHYSLKLINREEDFFMRELKYRKWFLLPPYYNVYTLEVKAGDLKTLGAEMRSIYLTYKEILNIKQIYLLSRKKIRGKFKGQVEVHASPQTIKKTSILKKKNVSIKIVAI